MKSYWMWLVEHCLHGAADIQENVSVDMFWRELLNALDSGAFGHTVKELRQYFQVIEDKRAKSPVSEHQTKAGADDNFKAWKSYLLYLRPGPVIELLRIFKRRNGADFPISQSDLLNQMKNRPYSHPSKHKSGHRQKFQGKGLSC